ncbi:hypothetical protein [Breoghania sp.]|uniref:hypothetical protein n=1 Tax=Breoghania sp. TaxID=2065378 RepID=UPI00261DBAF7|nr:hypothetical protein [Breoghania sp.]MDJ0929791.1 hypothetical protein [Breoghania sp.]
MDISDAHRLSTIPLAMIPQPRLREIASAEPLTRPPTEFSLEDISIDDDTATGSASDNQTTSRLTCPSGDCAQTFLNFLTQLQELGFFGGEGEDFVNYVPGANVTGTDEGDHIAVGSNASVGSGGGNDTIYAWSDSAIDAGQGDDFVSAWSGSRILGGAGNDHLTGWSQSRIDGGEGDDRIDAWSNSSVDGGDGDDDITVRSKSYAAGGSGDNIISAWTNSVIDGGSGGDTITANGATSIQFGEGVTPEGTQAAYSGTTATISFEGSEDTITVRQPSPRSTVVLYFCRRNDNAA